MNTASCSFFFNCIEFVEVYGSKVLVNLAFVLVWKGNSFPFRCMWAYYCCPQMFFSSISSCIFFNVITRNNNTTITKMKIEWKKVDCCCSKFRMNIIYFHFHCWSVFSLYCSVTFLNPTLLNQPIFLRNFVGSPHNFQNTTIFVLQKLNLNYFLFLRSPQLDIFPKFFHFPSLWIESFF